MARADRIESNWTASWILIVVLSVSGIVESADADVDLYAAPQFGISGLDVDTDGQAAGAAIDAYSGGDTDGSPLIGLSVGVEIPMNEIVPREWLEDVRLPSWPVRFELEAAGLRDYDFRTNGAGAGAEVYTSEIKATTLMANAWARSGP